MRGLLAGHRDRVAVAAALLVPPLVALALSPARTTLSDANVVLVLVLVVVAVAANGFRLAGVLASLSAGLWFDVFFTEPYLSVKIAGRADVETTLLLLVIGVAVSELALWGRRQQAAAVRDAGYLAGMSEALELSATGRSPSALARAVEAQLVEVLALSSCRYQAGVAGLGGPARLGRDGQVVLDGRVVDVEDAGLPVDVPIEVLVEGHGTTHGRFLLQAAPGVRPSLARRRLAVALADQLGAALR